MSDFRLAPYTYIHVKDTNTNVTRVEIGPQTFIKLDHEKILQARPANMITLSRRQYCIVENPIHLNPTTKEPIKDKFGQIKNNYGEFDYRFYTDYSEPFPLYANEKLVGRVQECPIVQDNEALKIRAKRNFKGDKGVERFAGDEYLFKGKGTYYPRVEEEVIEYRKPQIIEPGNAIRLRALQKITDQKGNTRENGEEWLEREQGFFLPNAYEEIIHKVVGTVQRPSEAIILKALKSFTDVYGIHRKAGEEWLVTNNMGTIHIIDIYESLVKKVNLTVLKLNEYVVITDPWDEKEKKNRFGMEIIKMGPSSFFLQPKETCSEVQAIKVLSERDALLVKAKEKYVLRKIKEAHQYEEIQELYKAKKTSELAQVKNRRNGYVRCVLRRTIQNGQKEYEEEVKECKHFAEYVEDEIKTPGDRWMEYGPQNFMPHVEVQILDEIKEIPLDQNEGIYIRNILDGTLRAHIGETYMLKTNEVLAEIDLDKELVDIQEKKNNGKKLDRTRVVNFKIPYNAAVQVYDYKAKTSRAVFGPDLVLLQPTESITVHHLSGGKPKKPNQMTSLAINLGPDFTSDMIEVETADHAKLQIKLAYNWFFRVKDKTCKKDGDMIFEVKDFVGDLCTTMASKIRSVVASITFENFHKSSAKLIRTSVFGLNENNKINDELLLEKNNLVQTNIDIQSVEPIEKKTRDSLKETVTLAIEITTKNQEEDAKRIFEKIKQEAEGTVERLNIDYQAKAEGSRMKLLNLMAESNSILNSGQANSEAQALANSNILKAQAMVEISKQKAETDNLIAEKENKRDEEAYTLKIEHELAMEQENISNSKAQTQIDSDKLKQIIGSLGKDTLVAMANAGIENQVRMLEGLGLKGYLLTDGNTPINLFSAAGGMLGNPQNLQKN